MVGDKCNTCHADYEFTTTNTKVNIYIGYPDANHVEVTCPNGHMERIFMRPTPLAELLEPGGFKLAVLLQPSNDLRESADRTWDAYDEGELPIYELPASLEGVLTSFGKAVASMPDDLLYDSIITEQPNTLPANWPGADTPPGGSND